LGKIVEKSFFWHFSIGFFFFFCDNCTLEELLNASGLRKYKKNDFFRKCSLLGGLFLDRKGLFTHVIPKKPAHFNFQSCSQHISPHFLFSHMLCKNISQLSIAVLHLFFELFFLGSVKNSYWFIYEII
jgi:hypothetical protein